MFKLNKLASVTTLALACTATFAASIGTLYDGKSGTTADGVKYIFYAKSRGEMFASPGNTKEITTKEYIEGKYDDRLFNGNINRCPKHSAVQKCEVKFSHSRGISYAIASSATVKVGLFNALDFGYTATKTKTESDTVEQSGTIHINRGTEVQFYIFIPRGTRVTRTLKGGWDLDATYTQSGKNYYAYFWKPDSVLMKLVTEERALYTAPVWTYSVKSI